MNQTLIGKLTGISAPKRLIKAKEEAEARLDRIHNQIAEQQQKASTSCDNLRKEAAVAMVDDAGAASKINAEISRLETEKAEAKQMVLELQRMLPAARKTVDAAQSEIEAYIGPKLLACRKEMLSQLERATAERAKSMNTRTDGRMVSKAPKKDSVSKVACCERSHNNPIGVISDDIRQPVRTQHFTSFTGGGFTLFRDCDMDYFKCPVCGGLPWREGDKILTNAGYRMVPEAVNLSSTEAVNHVE